MAGQCSSCWRPLAVGALLATAGLMVAALATLPGARPAGTDRHVRLTEDTGAERVVG